MVFYYLPMTPVYPLSTLLSSTGPMHILWYSTIFYWLPSYHCGTVLSSTVPLPIPKVLNCLPKAPAYPLVLYCLPLSQCLYYGTLLSSTGSLLIPIVLCYLLLVSCLSLWYSTIFYCISFYTHSTLLPSTGSLPIPMVLYYLLLVPCLYLLCSYIFFWLPAHHMEFY